MLRRSMHSRRFRKDERDWQGIGLDYCIGHGPRKSNSVASSGGVVAQRTHSANHYVVYPRNTPENHPPYGRMHDQFKAASGVHNSRPWDPWLPVVKNSRLLHSAGTAHGAPPLFKARGPIQRAAVCFCLARQSVLLKSIRDCQR